MMRARLLAAGFILAFVPGFAEAQPEPFAQAAQALVVAAAQPEPDRTEAVRRTVPRLAAALEDWDRAISTLEGEVERTRTDGTPGQRYRQRVELGIAYRLRGRLTDALREFEAAAAAQSSDSDLQVLRGLTLDTLGRSRDAAEAFRSAWLLDTANPVKAYYALQRRGLSSEDERDRAHAVIVNVYRRLASTPTRPAAAPFPILDVVQDTMSRAPVIGDAQTAEGFALLASGHYADAIAALSHPAVSTRKADDVASAHFARAQAHEAISEVTEARREYAAALDGALVGRSTIYVAIGRLAQVEGDLDAAIDAYEHAVRLNPNDPTMHQELAGAYTAVGRMDEAMRELVGGLLSDPTNAQLHAAVGQLRLDAGQPEEALPAFTRALALSPERYEVRYALATALTRLGRTSEAARQLEQFEQVRRQLLDQRRQGIQRDSDKEDAIRRQLATAGAAP